MTPISQLARETAERITRMIHDPLCERCVAEAIQSAIDEAVRNWQEENRRLLREAMGEA